jgi:hypothetical protein
MDIKEGRGKLYIIGGSEQFLSDIDGKLYQDLKAEPPRWWGEIYIDRGIKINEKEGHVIELEDGCRGQCFLRKLVNRVLPGIPARSVYRVNGIGLLK